MTDSLDADATPRHARMDGHGDVLEVEVELGDEVERLERRSTPLGALQVVWTELTAGVGVWGSLRPLVIAAAASLPFLFLGQHLNRQHRKALDWTAFQIPLLVTVIFWPPLWLLSIWDAYHEASRQVARRASEARRNAA